jgi:VCBS repeat protein
VNRLARRVLLSLCLILLPTVVLAAGDVGRLNVFVNEFKITGVKGQDELKASLQGLLASRLSSDRVTATDSPSGAAATVVASYIVFGKVFSLDAVVRDSSGVIVARAFEQGESADDLIPAVGRLGKKLTAELEKLPVGSQAATTAVTTAVPIAVPAGAPPAPPASPAAPKAAAAPAASGVATSSPQAEAGAGIDIVKPEPLYKGEGSGVVSGRLVGAMTGLALAGTTAGGERDYFLARDHLIQLYRQGKEVKLLAELSFPNDDKVIGIDTADLDNDGTMELYVTLVRGHELSSQVWKVGNSTFQKVAADLPYFFRAITGQDGKRRLYAQQMGRDEDFFGDVVELVLANGRYEPRNPIKMPRFATVYNFNQFVDKDGKRRLVVLHPDGNLLVYAEEGEELWRSNDKFGGSELYFSREDQENVRVTGELYRKIFLEQRLTVTGKGDIIVPQNSGFWVVGNSRSYSKSSVYLFSWNGVALEERWHTKANQNYLADYLYDDGRKELLLLEVVKKPGMVDKGASALSVKKVE